MKSTSDDEWRDKLTPEQYDVLRKGGTEPPFSGEHLDNHHPGEYRCTACGQLIFKSDAKYDSNTPGLAGWPSFCEVSSSGAVELKPDDSGGMHRTEVVCSTCGGHLGHLFDDPDSPSGKHYCINSVALNFDPEPTDASR